MTPKLVVGIGKLALLCWLVYAAWKKDGLPGDIYKAALIVVVLMPTPTERDS
jgi:hypothetical protein